MTCHPQRACLKTNSNDPTAHKLAMDLSDEDVKDAKAVFSSADSSGAGSLSADQAKAALLSLGLDARVCHHNQSHAIL